jgi:hypothetical protein
LQNVVYALLDHHSIGEAGQIVGVGAPRQILFAIAQQINDGPQLRKLRLHSPRSPLAMMAATRPEATSSKKGPLCQVKPVRASGNPMAQCQPFGRLNQSQRLVEGDDITDGLENRR